MATVAISSEIHGVSPGEYQAIVSLVDSAGTPVTMSQTAVSIPPVVSPVEQTAPVVTVS